MAGALDVLNDQEQGAGDAPPPQAPLSQVGPATQVGASFGAGNPAFSQLLNMAVTNQQMLMGRIPSAAQHEAALNDYIQAMQTAGKDERMPWEAALSGWGAGSKNISDAAQNASGMFDYMDKWRQAQRQDEAARQIVGPKAVYEDMLAKEKGMSSILGPGVMTQLAHAMLNPGMNVARIGVVNRLDPSQVMIAAPYIKEALDIRKKAEQNYVDRGGNDPTEQSKVGNEAVARYFSTLGPEITGGRGQFQQGATPSGATSGGPPPGMQYSADARAAQLADSNAVLAKERDSYAAAGKYAAANDVQKSIDNNNKVLASLQAAPSAPTAAATVAAPLAAPAAPTALPPVGTKEAATEKATQTQKGLADYENDLTQKAGAAVTTLRAVNHMLEESSAANFGAGADLKTSALKWADTLGIPLSEEEAAKMNGNQVLGKISMQLAASAVKSINASRPTQFEFASLLEKGVPNPNMTLEAFKRVAALYSETANKDAQQLQDYMAFKSRLPKLGDLSHGDFENYWMLKQNDPRFAKISPQDILDTMKASKGKYAWNDVLERLRGE